MYQIDESSAKLGQEYVIACSAEEFRNKCKYFVCLLCGISKKHSRLESHLTSLDHQIKFLAVNFPKVAQVVISRKKSSIELFLRQILNCIAVEINNNNEPTRPNIFNYLIYEDNIRIIHNEILSNVKSYDESHEYVKSMIAILEATFEPADSSQNDEKADPLTVSNDIQEKLDGETEASEKPAEVEEDSGVIAQDKPEELSAAEEAEHQEMAPVVTESQVNADESSADAEPITSVPAPSLDLLAMDTLAAAPQEPIDSESIRRAPPEIASTSSLNLPMETSPITMRDSEPGESIVMDTADDKSLSNQRCEVLTCFYREKSKKVQGALDKRYEMYKNRPLDHPNINIVNEWKKFYLECSYNVSQTRTYDYLEAWLSYCTQRVMHFKQEESQKLDMKLKKFLFNSPDEEVELQTPKKRQKLDMNEPESGHAHETLMNSYRLGYQHCQEGKRLTSDELLQLLMSPVRQAELTTNSSAN